MKKEDIVAAAQLLSAMKEALVKLEEAERKGDKEEIAIAKQEILNFQKKIERLL